MGTGILLVIAPAVLFRSPANTVRTGDELTALSWVIAQRKGASSLELFPFTISITVENGIVSSFIENCGKTVPPGPGLPNGIPFPSDYSQLGNNVSIVF